jgi:hypothetical protein
MDLSKDKQKIYSIEAEYYKEYMDEGNEHAISSRLNSVIKVLFVILLAILAYFTYKIIDGNLVVDDVINKKNIMNTFTSSTDTTERYVESLADEVEEKMVVEKVDVPVGIKEEVANEKVIIAEIKKVNTPIVEAPVVSKIEVVEHIAPVVREEIKSVTPSTVIVESKKETAPSLVKDDLLSDEYLKAMMSELNK